ncbi:MAG: hypothetical protein HY200_00250 [Nitrospirae bacterium]|nr:hypothetical protein [Nitrospirota bacterium]
MRTKVGLWIDQRKAIVVTISDKGEEMGLVISHVEKQPGRSGGVRAVMPFESQQVPADNRRQRKYTGHLNIYYGAVAASIGDAESIFIFGPGEAKTALKKLLVKEKMESRIVALETIDKMTHRQIAAKVRRHFHHQEREKRNR